MIKYGAYTAKQENEMNRLGARATRYKMKIDEINRQLATPVISFEENVALREKLQMFKDLFKKAVDEIEEIGNQRKVYDKHLETAKKHLTAAEELKEKWGF